MATVKMFASLRLISKEKEFNTGAGTLDQALEEAALRYGPHFSEKLRLCTILVNGRHTAHLNPKTVRLKPDDTVSLFPPLAGG